MIVRISVHPEAKDIINQQAKYYNQLVATLDDQQIEILKKLLAMTFEQEKIACDVAFYLGYTTPYQLLAP